MIDCFINLSNKLFKYNFKKFQMFNLDKLQEFRLRNIVTYAYKKILATAKNPIRQGALSISNLVIGCSHVNPCYRQMAKEEFALLVEKQSLEV